MMSEQDPVAHETPLDMARRIVASRERRKEGIASAYDSHHETLARAVLDLSAQHDMISSEQRRSIAALVANNRELIEQRNAARAEVEKREATIGVAGLLLTDAMASLEGFLDHIGDCWEWVSRDGELNAGCNEMRRLQRRLKKARAALGEEGS